MMISTILDYLRSDDELVSLLGHTKNKPKITAYEPHDKNDYPYIVVTMNPSNFGIVIDEYRCEIRIVTDDQLLVEPLERRVNQLMNFRNRNAIQLNNETLFHSSFTGSGYLFNFDDEGQVNVGDEKTTKVFEQVLNYTTKFKNKG
ncbi:hypothetical protein MUN88_17040 [Gracilibacillus caseinilyticus]|uniref:Sensory transduction regulator n=1 Tax=Gracilibacillus caseinilyticus TaxID=2932256 RepID=A0ABY4ETJ4_9BACI|nr:hypothetical protein [Gracilibacillus caseinilyticus]UOQ47738.1 hypothetical protein MUN88_17040 [Gracilibacillus caseinilyticus]